MMHLAFGKDETLMTAMKQMQGWNTLRKLL
jgi:hypothetical protein